MIQEGQQETCTDQSSKLYCLDLREGSSSSGNSDRKKPRFSLEFGAPGEAEDESRGRTWSKGHGGCGRGFSYGSSSSGASDRRKPFFSLEFGSSGEAEDKSGQRRDTASSKSEDTLAGGFSYGSSSSGDSDRKNSHFSLEIGAQGKAEDKSRDRQDAGSSQSEDTPAGGFFYGSSSSGDSGRKKPLFSFEFGASREAEDKSREPRYAENLRSEDTPAEQFTLKDMDTGRNRKNKEFAGDKSTDLGTHVNSTNTRLGAGFSSSGASLNVGFGLGTSDEKGLEVGRADGSETRGSGPAGGETIVFGTDAGDTNLRSEKQFVGGGSRNLISNLWDSGEEGFGIKEIGGNGMSGSVSKGFGSDASSSENLGLDSEKFGKKGFESNGSGWNEQSSSGSDDSGSVGKSWLFEFGLGEMKFGAEFNFRDSGLNQSADNGNSSKNFDGNGVGGSSARNGFEYSGGISEDSEAKLGSSDQHGFKVSRTGGNRKRSSEPAKAGNLSPGSDVNDSGGNTWSSGSGSDGESNGADGLGVGASGLNEFGETVLTGTEKGSHIPEATPKYSETSAIIGEASTWSKGAYKSFNGRIFSFESSCPYTFCRHCVESGGDFNIEIKRNKDSEIEKITLTLHKQYPTCGLCGNFNSTPGKIPMYRV
ncbi:hypothetical protein P7K49_019401 [Saguinus oedipus]|uniref:VWFD domain-containing protein n=1 Tax=Saguinus oedipus TaxID=9490 RepID=A0ABQ9UXC4_SAGOE|nr:hypothetical protein P7K49_019401 [Saguinus oedipus]